MQPSEKPVRCVVVGAGTFGASIVAQAAYAAGVEIVAVVDANFEKARVAYRLANVAEDRIANCEQPGDAVDQVRRGRVVVAARLDAVIEAPFDVLVEATGNAEAGAVRALAGIEHGKHIAMVNKETDATVGPILKRLADDAGVVYTAVDGDQHGMAIGLVAWAREMGLEVIAAGKILDREMVVDVGGEDGNWDVDSTGNDAGNDRTRGAVLRFKNGVIPLSDEARDLFLPRNARRASRNSLAQVAAARARYLNDVGRIDNWDLCELAIMCNGTGLPPDLFDAASDHRSNTDSVHCPLAYTTEIPELLCERDHGGLLARRGVIDAIRLLRQPHEAGLGGGVFAVVASPSAHVREMMNHKGVVHHPDGHAALLLRPHHLLGVETIHSIVMAGRARVPTGATTYQPLYDVVYTARRDLKAGERIGDDHSRDLLSKLVPAVHVDRNDPLPAHLASGRVLVAGVSAGAAIRRDDVERAGTSVLWALRERQDRAFA